MKVRDQVAHDLEIVRWPNEEVGVAGARPNPAVLVYRSLECTHHRRPHRPDVAAMLIYQTRGVPANLVRLRMHRMSVELVSLDRLERPRPHVQIDPGDERALRLNAGEELGCEMQAGRRCGDAAVMRRVDG